MQPRAGLFVTCLIDVVRPSIGFAAARLIEASGCRVVVPDRQTCCGQPSYNAGDRASSRALALQTIHAFRDCDYVVAPSGSCAAMLKVHYPRLLEDDPAAAEDARAFADRVHELCAFLHSVRHITEVPGRMSARVTYHDSCSGLRELAIKQAPRRLLALMPGIELAEMADSEACCGFGGLFAEKYPDISNAIVTRNVTAARAVKPDILAGGDLGCLMNIAGKIARQGHGPACRHVAELLAGELDDLPIAGTGGRCR